MSNCFVCNNERASEASGSEFFWTRLTSSTACSAEQLDHSESNSKFQSWNNEINKEITCHPSMICPAVVTSIKSNQTVYHSLSAVYCHIGTSSIESSIYHTYHTTATRYSILDNEESARIQLFSSILNSPFNYSSITRSPPRTSKGSITDCGCCGSLDVSTATCQDSVYMFCLCAVYVLCMLYDVCM